MESEVGIIFKMEISLLLIVAQLAAFYT